MAKYMSPGLNLKLLPASYILRLIMELTCCGIMPKDGGGSSSIFLPPFISHKPMLLVFKQHIKSGE